MTNKLTINEEEELIRVTSKMPVTSGLDKALSISISIESIESVEIKDNYLNIEYPKDYNKWSKKVQDNWKQAVINEEKRKKRS